MVKKYKSRKTTKKLKKINNVKHKLKKVVNSKNKKYRKTFENKFPKKEPKNNPKNTEISKISLDAQASIKVLCCSCNKNITNQIKIILEPMNPNMKILQKGLTFNALCVECFILKTKFNSEENTYYVGNEITLYDFKFSHFIILNKMTENIFTNDWSLADEIKLLGAIEKLGLENWEEISKILNKGKFECESHYYTFYYKAKDDYLPSDKKININNSSKNLLKENKKEENKNILKIEENIGYIPFSENNKPNRSISKNIIKKDEQGKNKPINQNMYDSLGYWEKRKDFDIEYKNEAEIQLSELEFNDEDTPAQIRINYKNLKNYNNILDEREERKRIVEEKNLYDVRKQIILEKTA